MDQKEPLHLRLLHHADALDILRYRAEAIVLAAIGHRERPKSGAVVMLADELVDAIKEVEDKFDDLRTEVGTPEDSQ